MSKVKVAVVLTALGAAVSGCATVAGGAADAYNYLSGEGKPPAMLAGEVCYPEREAFYDAAARARNTNAILAGGEEFVTDLSESLRGTAFSRALGEDFEDAVSGLKGSLQEDGDRIRAFNATYEALNDCRVDEARRIRRSGVSRSAKNAQLRQIREVHEDDLVVARATSAEMTDRTDRLLADVQVARRSASTPQQKRQSSEATEAVQTNQKELRETSSEIEVAEVEMDSELSLEGLGLVLLLPAVACRRRRTPGVGHG